MKIVLIGFMCSGKSTVARQLAKKLNWPHCDTDDLIESDQHKSIAEIIASQGEATFRQIEQQIVERVARRDQIVVSTGGGTPLNESSMALLRKNASVIWLKVSAETVLKRAGDLSSRPLIDPARPWESVVERLTQREPVYANADHMVDADLLKPTEIVQQIMSFVPSLK